MKNQFYTITLLILTLTSFNTPLIASPKAEVTSKLTTKTQVEEDGLNTQENNENTTKKVKELKDDKLENQTADEIFFNALITTLLIRSSTKDNSSSKLVALIEENNEQLNKVIFQKPNFAEAYWTRGIAKNFLKQTDAALEDYNKALQLNPSFAQAYLSRAELYSKLKKKQLAIDDYTSFLKLDNILSEVSIELPSKKSKQLHRITLPLYSKANSNLYELSDAQIENQIRAIVHSNRANLKLEEYRDSGAKEDNLKATVLEIFSDYDKAIELDPNNEFPYINRAYIKKEWLNDALGAEEDLNKSKEIKAQKKAKEELKKSYKEALKNYHSKEYETALEQLNNLLLISPEEQKPVIHYQLGLTYQELNNTAEAISSYSKAIELKPDYELAYFRRGFLYSRIGKSKIFFNGDSYKAAVNDFMKVIEINPKNADAYFNIALISFKGAGGIGLAFRIQKLGDIENSKGTGFLQKAEKLYKEQNNEAGLRRVSELRQRIQDRRIDQLQRNSAVQQMQFQRQMQEQYLMRKKW